MNMLIWSHTLKVHGLVQSDLGCPATSGLAHISISDLAGHERCLKLNTASSEGLNKCCAL